jgi:hypothetical protein
MNPLVFVSFASMIVYDIYAAIVLLFRLPRLRVSEVPAWLGFWSRVGVATVFALNWTWLIVSRR